MSKHDLWEDPNLPSALAAEINRERMATYGSPVPNMVKFAQIISIILDVWVSPQQAAMICIGLKMMREIQSEYDPEQPDHLRDICGFANVLYHTKEAADGDDTVPNAAHDPAGGEGPVGEEELPKRQRGGQHPRRSRRTG